MANVTLDNIRILTRNDTQTQWSTVNPVLLKGELGYDSDAKMLKIGDGTTAWNDLDYLGAKPAEGGDGAPGSGTTDKELGSIYVDTTSHKAYILVDKSEDSATWKQIITPEDLSNLGAGDMLKAEFATNGKASQGYVDKAILADTATEATHAASADTATNATTAASADKLTTGRTISVTGDATGTSAAFDGSANASINLTLANSGVEAGTFTKVTVDAKGRVTQGAQLTLSDIPAGEEGDTLQDEIDNLKSSKQDVITGAATTITTTDLTAGKVVVSNESGKIATTTMDTTTLEGLPGRIDTIAGQIDNIPKYNYLTGVNATTDDANINNQEEIDNVVIPIIEAAHTEPAPQKWDAVVANIIFTPSDVEKDAVYYFNGTDWVFLYYVSTGINRANGTTAGIVEDSADITFADGQGTVVQAGKVKNALTIGVKSFDGSSPVTINTSDITTLLPYATNTSIGVVQGSTDINKVSVGDDHTMTVNNIAVAKLSLNGDTLVLNGGNA